MTQFKTDHTRIYCGTTGGNFYPNAKQAATVRHVSSKPCAGTWSNFKGRWCICGLGSLKWRGSSKHADNAPEADHSCVNVAQIVEFLAECINAGLVKDISTDLTFDALGHR